MYSGEGCVANMQDMQRMTQPRNSEIEVIRVSTVVRNYRELWVE